METRAMDAIIWLNLVATAGMAASTTTALPELKDYCEFEKFSAKCKANEVVVMNRAIYGRMRLGRCVTTDLGFVGCDADVLDLADRKCSGKRSCQVQIPDESFASRPTCMNELKSYLEADYSCLPVVTVNDRCTTCEHARLTEPKGYLSSFITQETGCGAPACPWLIQAQSGQLINITLIDFFWKPREHVGSRKPCTVYATIKETHTQKSHTVCPSGIQREEHVYTSVSNSVTLRIVGKDADLRTPQQFLFKYEVIACADPPTPAGAWMSRSGDVADFGCNESSVSWKLVCDGRQWQGEHRHCPTSGNPGRATAVISSNKIPYGLSIAVILAVAVVVGLLILVFGLIIVKRRRNQALQQQSIYQVPPQAPPPYKDPSYFPQNAAEWQYQEPSDNFDKQLTSTDCSGYTHIWERPLPKPANRTSGTGAAQNGSGSTDNEYQRSTASGDYNTIGSLSNGSRNGNEYGQAYGNNTLARKEMESEDPRYFQLDPDTLPPPPPSLTDK